MDDAPERIWIDHPRTKTWWTEEEANDGPLDMTGYIRADLLDAARELVPAMRNRIEADAKRIAELALDALAAGTQAAEAYQAQLTAKDRIAELEAAGENLIRIVEGIDGAMTHGTWRAERSNLRMKDTDEWVRFYCAVRAALGEKNDG